MNKPKISVIICTYNRPVSTVECLKSLEQNSFQNYEIILIDQSNNEDTAQLVRQLNSRKLYYYRQDIKGVGQGKNFAISKVKTPLIAFTDSDCIVDPHWLESIIKFYAQHPKVAGIFGSTLPFQPELHQQEICPSTFSIKSVSKHSDPSTIHYRELGLGNNMSLRKSIIDEVGKFKVWLGPGSVGQNGEESELIFRIFLHNHVLMTNPKMVVYHNRWLSYKNERILQSQYTCGLMAFFSYYLLTQYKYYAFKFIKIRLSERLIPMFKQTKYSSKEFVKEVPFAIFELFSVLKGICIGLIITSAHNLTGPNYFKNDEKTK